MCKYQISYKKGNTPFKFDFLAYNESDAREKFEMWKNQNLKWFDNIKLNVYITFSNHVLTKNLM